MQYVPNESANTALAIAINLLDALTDKGLISAKDRTTLLQNAMMDLEGNTVSNIEARKTLSAIARDRYRTSIDAG